MSSLSYEKKGIERPREPEIYRAEEIQRDESYRKAFQLLKVNVCDLNPALIKKCITGTEQDFILLMDRAKDFLLKMSFPKDQMEQLLTDFRDCVFGYYVLTPLILDPKVSDIKVLSFDHIVVKANGKRYVTNLSFRDEEDCRTWFERIMMIQGLNRKRDGQLLHCTDRKGVKDYYLRIDFELSNVTSTEDNNIHIRKTPKEKLSWDYLFENHMLDQDLLDYLTDRINAGFGFLISGRGGSGKSTLLNNMIDLIPFDESILVSQESDELYSNVHPQIQFEHTLTEHTEERETEYSLEDELRLGLLQDIDNFIIGEIKGGEALYVFTTAMSTGARFFGTIHSNDAKGSVIRLAQCARYISDYPMETLEEMLTATPFCLIHMSRFSIDEILEITGWDEKEHTLTYQKVFRKESV